LKAYLDTNVLIAASAPDHPHHGPAFDLLAAVKERALKGCINTHGLAEFYSVLTRAPFSPRVHPVEAGRFLDDNILPYLELIALSTNDYKVVLSSCSHAGWVGGMVYDALHMHSARKAQCDRIYTFNLKDFRVIASPDMLEKISAP
jgi:predicted nucleic acid-binding protein